MGAANRETASPRKTATVTWTPRASVHVELVPVLRRAPAVSPTNARPNGAGSVSSKPGIGDEVARARSERAIASSPARSKPRARMLATLPSASLQMTAPWPYLPTKTQAGRPFTWTADSRTARPRVLAKNRSTTAYGRSTPRFGSASTCTVRFELGHANKFKVLDPVYAAERAQPAIVIIGRVSAHRYQRAATHCSGPASWQSLTVRGSW